MSVPTSNGNPSNNCSDVKNVNLMVTPQKSQGITKLIMICYLGTMDICNKFHVVDVKIFLRISESFGLLVALEEVRRSPN